ncbi:hypothetical protein ABZ490_51175 [Streptomyces sp. NPDC005811]
MGTTELVVVGLLPEIVGDAIPTTALALNHCRRAAPTGHADQA